MYHIVYLTTNLINGKIYVGVHETYNLNDGYKGSGIGIKNAFRKYKKRNFKCQILHYCVDSDHAYELEEQIVDKWFISRPDTYNQVTGGKHYSIGRTYSLESVMKLSKTRKEKGLAKGQLNNGSKTNMLTDQRITKASKAKETRIKNGGYVVSEETKIKKSVRTKGISKPQTEEHKLNLRKSKRTLFITNPKGVMYIIQGTFYNFCDEHKLSKNIFPKYIDKGSISIPKLTKGNRIRPQTTLNCNGWSISTKSPLC